MTRDDPAAFAPPPAFGPFRVLHQIGIGALGPVFRTYEPTRDRLVAVKVFRLDVTPEQARSLADELGRAADASLFHPSIVEPIAAGVEGTVAYRAEEYVAAESLDVAIRHYAPADLDKALPFLAQLAGAIDFARTAGVGHGALHLRDVFVTPDEARASGFGIVEALERIGLRAPVRRPYSAPERVAGAAWSTPADVFSLAAIAYEMLTGRRPSGTGEQIAALSGENVGPNGPAIRAVLSRAMDDDPARRYRTALAFASALEGAARGAGERFGVAPVGGPANPEANALNEDTLRTDARDETRERIEDDDIAIERDEDSAHDALRQDDTDEAPGLFDDAEDESLADRALDEPVAAFAGSSPWDGDGGAAGARHAPLSLREDAAAPTPESPRPAMLPLAVTLVLGLLLGFAAGYSVGGRESVPPPSAAAPPPSAPAQPPAPGRAWSEQTVAPPTAGTPQPSAEVPPVPGDGPAAPGAPTSPPRPTTGKLVVRSSPSGAAVTVNGKWRGRTPLNIDALQFGPYAVRIVRSGFTTVQEDVTLSAREPSRTLSLRLERVTASAAAPGSRARRSARGATSVQRPTVGEPSAFAGSIFVDSRPRGARVFIDGRPMGTTPASIPDIPIGSHVVRLELTDHRAWTTSTRVTAGQAAVVTGSLERIR